MSDSVKARRLSITKLQRNEAAVTDLISICQAATADGTLSDSEIAELQEWTRSNEDLDLPAKDYLSETISRIAADGVITADERRALFLAIEKVLPPDLRADVRGARIEVERAELQARRADRAKAIEQAKLLRAANRPLQRWNFMVAGVRYEGRPAVIRDHVGPGDSVRLLREPANPFSRNACQIRLENDLQIGFVPEEHATELAPYLYSGSKYHAYVTKVLTGGRSPIPVVQVELYGPEATLPELHQACTAPSRTAISTAGRDRSSSPSLSGRSVILWIIALVVLIWIIGLVA